MLDVGQKLKWVCSPLPYMSLQIIMNNYGIIKSLMDGNGGVFVSVAFTSFYSMICPSTVYAVVTCLSVCRKSEFYLNG